MKIFSKIKNKNSGFTLIEMAVVLGIFLLISGLIIFNYSDFHSNVSLENLAQDVALNIRRAQSYATGSKGAGSEFPGYGIHFNTDSNFVTQHSGGPKSFIFFADLASSPVPSGYPIYDESNVRKECGYDNLIGGNECIEDITINSTDIINEICLNGSSCVPGTLDIVFTRPDPDPTFCFLPTGSSMCAGSVSSASIHLISVTGKEKVITVWNTGQINTE